MLMSIVPPLSSVCLAGQLHVSNMLHAEIHSQCIVLQVLRKGAGLQQSIRRSQSSYYQQVLWATKQGGLQSFSAVYAVSNGTGDSCQVGAPVASSLDCLSHPREYSSHCSALPMCTTEQLAVLLSIAFQVTLHCQLLCETAVDVGCRVPETESIFFNLPNLHFLPCTPVTSKVSASVV